MKKNALTIAFEEIEQGVEAPELDFELQLQMPTGVLDEDSLGPIDTYNEVQQAVEHLNICLEQYIITTQATEILASESITNSDKNVLNSIIKINSKQHFSSESISDTLVNMTKSVYEAITAMIKRFIEFIKSFFINLGTMRKKLLAYKEQAKKLESYSDLSGISFDASKAPNGFFTPKGTFKNEKEFLDYLTDGNKWFSDYLKYNKFMVDLMETGLNKIKDNSSSLDNGKYTYSKISIELIKAIKENVGDKLDLDYEKIDDGDVKVFKGQTLPGFIHLELTLPIISNKLSEKEIVSSLNKVKIEKINEEGKIDRNNEVDFKFDRVANLRHFFDILEKTLEIGDDIETFYKIKVMKTFDSINKCLKNIDNKEDNAETKRYVLKLLLTFSKLMSQMSSIPISMIMDICRTSFFLLDHSIHSFETKSKHM